MRREEVAELAGNGVDWYVRLEQGRSASPSATTVDALARALRLGEAEDTHLLALARNAGRRAFSREEVPAAIRRLVEGLVQPAYVTGRRRDVLAWNAAAAGVFADFGRLAEEDRDIPLRLLAGPGARRLFGAAWADEAERMAARFRATHDAWVGDPAFLDILERLRRASPEFAAWREAHDIRGGGAGQKLLRHPEKGPLRFGCATFRANDDPALKLAIYTPVPPPGR